MATSSDRKSYGQMCALVMALDRVGDRWTILIIRELLGGPARFGELKDGLPGIATNLLTSRLRRLEEDGLVRRTGGYNTLYSLTPTGRAIRGAVEALGQWGLSLGPMGPAALVSTPRSLAMPLQSVLGVAGAAHGDLPDLVIELVVDDEPIELVLGPTVTATARAAVEPASRATSTIEDLSAFMMGGVLSDTTIEHLDGDAAATRVLVELFAAAAAMAAA